MIHAADLHQVLHSTHQAGEGMKGEAGMKGEVRRATIVRTNIRHNDRRLADMKREGWRIGRTVVNCAHMMILTPKDRLGKMAETRTKDGAHMKDTTIRIDDRLTD
jgi:hypothetical protein